MNLKLCGIAMTLASCDVTPLSAPNLVPALHGVRVIAASDHASTDVIDRISQWVEPGADCVANAYGGIEVSADVAPIVGNETVLASFSQGIFVIGADGNLIASAEGFPCKGSQDELVSLQVVQPFFGRPMIAVTATEGGKREWAASLKLLAVDDSPQLVQLFIGDLERHDEHGLHSGDVTLFPGALLYHRPSGSLSLWPYDTASGHYAELPTAFAPPLREGKVQH